MRITVIYLILVLLSSAYVYARQPPRKAIMGGYGTFSSNGLAIDSIAPATTFATIGLRRGDTVRQVNDGLIKDQATYNTTVGPIRAGQDVTITYRRNGSLYTKHVKAVMRPYESSSTADIIYGWASMDNCRLRTIVRKPKGQQKLPAVLLVPGYNCGSVENYNQGSYSRLIDTWIKAGFAVVTIEKSGLGDSYGCLPCSEVDLVTDIKGFEAGYAYMASLPYVDTANLFIWGHSMGGVIAPVIAAGHHPRGVMVFATVYRPWSEFLLEMHRIQLPLDGKSYAETENFIRRMQKIYYEYFRLRKSPEQLYQNPEYRDLVVSELEYKKGETNMWGRHWRFWQQLDSIDLARNWAAVDAPVLSLFGGADWIACSELEHQLIVRTVNSTHPGHARHICIPDVDHLLVQNKDWISAHKNISDATYRNTHFHQGLADTTVQWMRSVMKQE